MKQHLLLLLFATAIPLARAERCEKNDSCDNEITAKTFLFVRPQCQSQSPELWTNFLEDRLQVREDGCGGAFQTILFGGASILSDKMQRYFTPFGKITIIVDEKNPNANKPNNVDRDLLATHYGIHTEDQTYRSEISFEPKQETVGWGIHYRQAFARNKDNNRGFFFSISTPLIFLRNEFKLIEKILNDGGGVIQNSSVPVVANMAQAFDQPSWCYGRISPCAPAMKKVGLADIELKIGMEWLEREPCHLESYIGIQVPTGTKVTGHYIFETVVGNGRHVGFMMGTSFGARIWHNEERGWDLRSEYATHSNYLFKAEQVRSFDLKNKPFSRYMEVYANQAQAEEAAKIATQALALPESDPMKETLTQQAQYLGTPGINVFTQSVDVTPGFTYNISTALVFTTSYGLQATGGYNFYTHRAECVTLTCPWELGPALKHYNGNGLTNPVRDSTGRLLLESATTSDPEFIDPFPEEHSLAQYKYNMITEDDLDLVSASTPCALSHTIFATLGFRWDDREYPVMLHGGGSYEFSNANNASIERWTIWVKMGVSF